MTTPILSFRPGNVVAKLPPQSAACILNVKDVLRAVAGRKASLPIFRAPVAAVVRAVLLAAKEARSAVGLMLPEGGQPHAWFQSVAQAADELAPEVPLFLCGTVVIEGDDPKQLERAAEAAFKLVDAGVTHVAVDPAAVAPNARARATLQVAQAATERELGLELVLPPYGGIPAASRAAGLVDALEAQGTTPDLVSVRAPAPYGEDDAQAQLGRLSEIAAGLGSIPVLRRGTTSPALLASARAAQLKVYEDGGLAFGAALRGMPADTRDTLDQKAAQLAGATPTNEPLEAAAAAMAKELAALPQDVTDRVEAKAYLEAAGFIEAVGGQGTAPMVFELFAERPGY